MSFNSEATPQFESPFLYGTLSCGADTWKNALGNGKQVFSCDSLLRSNNTLHRTNYHRTNWDKYPSLNLLIVQEKAKSKINQTWLKDWGYPHRATNILVFHEAQTLTGHFGKAYKMWCKCIRGRGYATVTDNIPLI